MQEAQVVQYTVSGDTLTTTVTGTTVVFNREQ